VELDAVAIIKLTLIRAARVIAAPDEAAGVGAFALIATVAVTTHGVLDDNFTVGVGARRRSREHQDRTTDEDEGDEERA
jgi:hypothetical protein